MRTTALASVSSSPPARRVAGPGLIYSRIGRVRQRVSMSLFPGLLREWERRMEGLG
jgi:hypothetical protein